MTLLSVDQAEAMAAMSRHAGVVGRRLLLALAGVEAVEAAIEELSRDKSPAWLVGEVLATETVLRRNLRLVERPDEIDRAVRACGVVADDVPDAVRAVLGAVGAGGDNGPDLPVKALLESGVSLATVTYVALEMLRTDLFDYVHDELHDLISDLTAPV